MSPATTAATSFMSRIKTGGAGKTVMPRLPSPPALARSRKAVVPRPPSNPAKIRLDLAYDGTAYVGWQVQPASQGQTIQGVLEERLAQLYANQPIRVHGSGRTDTGVHALAQVAHFQPPANPRIPLDELPRILNGMLPGDIRVHAAKAVPESFHARFETVGKAYAYVLHRGIPDPFCGRWSWLVPDCADLPAMRRAARRLLGQHDFSAFAATTADHRRDDKVRTIHRIAIRVVDDRICLTFVGDGFLYKMVRSLTAALVEVGRGRLTPSAMAEILATKNRAAAPSTAPARGLFLVRVFYRPAELAAFRPIFPPQ